MVSAPQPIAHRIPAIIGIISLQTRQDVGSLPRQIVLDGAQPDHIEGLGREVAGGEGIGQRQQVQSGFDLVSLGHSRHTAAPQRFRRQGVGGMFPGKGTQCLARGVGVPEKGLCARQIKPRLAVAATGRILGDDPLEVRHGINRVLQPQVRLSDPEQG